MPRRRHSAHRRQAAASSIAQNISANNNAAVARPTVTVPPNNIPAVTQASTIIPVPSTSSSTPRNLDSVDSRPAQSLAEEIDLTQESQANRSTGNVQVTELGDLSVMTGKAKNTGPSKKTGQKNRKRKLEEDGDDAQPICSLCNTLIEVDETLFVGSCGHLFCAPCTRNRNFSDCGMCGKKIKAFRRVFF